MKALGSSKLPSESHTRSAIGFDRLHLGAHGIQLASANGSSGSPPDHRRKFPVASGHLPDIPEVGSERTKIAEAVEEVRKLKYFETMIRISGLLRINIAENAVYRSGSCAKLVGPDFFNRLSQITTFRVTVGLTHLNDYYGRLRQGLIDFPCAQPPLPRRLVADGCLRNEPEAPVVPFGVVG